MSLNSITLTAEPTHQIELEVRGNETAAPLVITSEVGDAYVSRDSIIDLRLRPFYSGAEAAWAYETLPEFVYGLTDELIRIEYASGNYREFTYNLSGQLISMIYYVDSAPLVTLEYNYDLEGRLISIT